LPINILIYIPLLASGKLNAGDISIDAFLAPVRFAVCASCPGSSGERNLCPVRRESPLISFFASLSACCLLQGGILLSITQVKPGSGSSTGGSGQIFFGTYEFQFFDGTGRPL
jgi:hypothetical protein